MAVNIKVKHLKERYPGVLGATMLAHTESPEHEASNPEGSAQGSRDSYNSGLTNYISLGSPEHTPSSISSSERGKF
jgi:hypothetical protein